MLNNITIGQFFPTGSVIHRLDPSVKLVLTLILIVSIFIASVPVTLGLCLVVTFALMCISKIRLTTYLKMLKAVLPIIILTAILNALYAEGEVLFQWWIFKVTDEGIQRAVFIAVRICLLVMVSSLLTYTTSPTELTDGIERLLKPLRFIGLGEAVHVLAMMTSIALRFIPILIEETDKIMSAQKARGADMESGNIIQRIKAMMPVLIPLLISATRRAIDLAEAMECRCYHGGTGRTKMKQSHAGVRDAVAILIIGSVFAATIVGRVVL